MNDSFGGGWIFAFLIIAVIFGWGGGGFGGNNAAFATMADVNAVIEHWNNNYNALEYLQNL